MTKKVSFPARPKKQQNQMTADDWVSSGSINPPEMKEHVETTRFTIDIPIELHSRIKSQCALRRVKMREEIQSLLEKHFSEE